MFVTPTNTIIIIIVIIIVHEKNRYGYIRARPMYIQQITELLLQRSRRY